MDLLSHTPTVAILGFSLMAGGWSLVAKRQKKNRDFGASVLPFKLLFMRAVTKRREGVGFLHNAPYVVLVIN